MASRKQPKKTSPEKKSTADEAQASSGTVDALQESEARYRAVVRQSADCVTLVDAGTLRLLEANPAFFELLGYREEDLPGLTVYDIVAHDRTEVDRNAQRIIEEQEHYLGERTYKRKDGSTVEVEVSAHLISSAGRLAMCAVARDITERKSAEAERARLEMRFLQVQKMEAIGQLTAGVAHNFNNTLAAVMGNLELAMAGASDKIRLFLEEALKASEKAADMVQEMGLFSRDPEVDRGPVRVYSVVREVVEICRKTFDRKIEIELSAEGELPSVHSTTEQLRVMTMHLCINARDALEALPPINRLSRQIRIEVGKVDLDHEEAGRHPQARAGEYLRISVFDNGIGMSAETQRRIFEPFFTTKGVDKGTGLGLSSVYAIAQQHGGWVEVESHVYSGSRFDVYLALEPDMELLGEAEGNGSSLYGTETVLVIEDEDSVRMMVRTMLVQHGYKVLEAADGGLGLETLERHGGEIRLVILDVSLPAVSGAEVLAELRNRYPRVKVVICTGYSTDLSSFVGASEVIKKPFRVKHLLQSVRHVLDS